MMASPAGARHRDSLAVPWWGSLNWWTRHIEVEPAVLGGSPGAGGGLWRGSTLVRSGSRWWDHDLMKPAGTTAVTGTT